MFVNNVVDYQKEHGYFKITHNSNLFILFGVNAARQFPPTFLQKLTSTASNCKLNTLLYIGNAFPRTNKFLHQKSIKNLTQALTMLNQ